MGRAAGTAARHDRYAGGLKTGSIRQQESNGSKMKEGEVEVSSASKVAETRIRGQAGAFPRPSSWNCTFQL